MRIALGSAILLGLVVGGFPASMWSAVRNRERKGRQDASGNFFSDIGSVYGLS